MRSSTFAFTSNDAAQLFVYRWFPDDSPKAIIHIAHGMAEHAGRYDRLARSLADVGYGVYANDHRGHGRSAGSSENLGHIANHGGWSRLIDDLRLLIESETAENRDIPMILLGHSMGSFLAQQFLCAYNNLLEGCILSSSGCRLDVRYYLMKALAFLERIRLGKNGRSDLLHGLALRSANREFQPVRTPYDWLTRDTAEIDRYLADPYSGCVMSNQFWVDLLAGLKKMVESAKKAQIPTDFPLYILAGGKDPLGDNGRGMQDLIRTYTKAGVKNIRSKFYPDGRHELFNEINRDEVISDLLLWLNEVVTPVCCCA